MDVKISKGANIKIKGSADRVYANHTDSGFYALKPTDFHSLIPKMVVREGDYVMAGDVLFNDKKNEKIKFTSPVSGHVLEIKRERKEKFLKLDLNQIMKLSTKNLIYPPRMN